MTGVLQSRVPRAAEGQPLIDWLAARFRYCDAARWREHVTAGRVSRNGEPARTHDPLRAGDLVAFVPDTHGVAGADVPVLHVDEDLVVVDKPPHRVVQHASTVAGATFLGALARLHPPAPGTPRLEPVHRLDRETSGVLLLSRDAAATRALQRQFEAGAVTKSYTAIVHGIVAAHTQVVDAPIGPAPASAIAARRAVVAAGSRGARPARTEVRVEQRLPRHTVLSLRPHTGRTHQLRVHLEHLGHAIVGDKLYGRSDEGWLDWVQHLKADGDPRWRHGAPVVRQLLHAEALHCRHPRTGHDLALQAPRPADFAAFAAAAANGDEPGSSPR